MCTSPQLPVAFVANGVIHDYHAVSIQLQTFSRVIAVDGGLKHCHKMHIRPDMIVGDMDSIDPDLMKHYADVPVSCFPVEKDETDLEIALRMECSSPTSSMTVFGGLEGRTDHTLYNLNLLCRYPRVMTLESETETLFAIQGKTSISCKKGQTISLIPLGEPAIGVTTRGLKWELQNRTLDSSFMSLSNICLAESFEVTVGSGFVLCSIVKHLKSYSRNYDC